MVDDVEGSYVELGVNFLKKFNLPIAVIDAVEQHHEDKEFSSKESVLVYIADAISGSRPALAMKMSKTISNGLTVSRKSPMATRAWPSHLLSKPVGELRVVVTPEKVADDQLPILASEIKDEIQNSLTYPGTVKVTVVRETRAIDVAK